MNDTLLEFKDLKVHFFTDEGVGTQVLPGVPTKIRSALYRTSGVPR